MRAALSCLMIGWAVPLGAVECRQALALALDVSSSVDTREDLLQRGGVAAALVAPEVQQAFFSSPEPVALAVYEWSGRNNQKLLLDWVMIRHQRDLLRAAETLGRSERSSRDFPTAIGHAMGYGAMLLQRGPRCLTTTIDVSGDGENNEGFGPQQAYAHFPFEEVVVNGLVIISAGAAWDDAIVAHYREELIHGPGAFLEIAQGFEDFERAMRRKLVRELRPLQLGEAK